MNQNLINEDKILNSTTENKKIQRRFTVYSLSCEGRRTDEIAELFNVSERTIYRDIEWCRDNLKKDYGPTIRSDILYDTFRRRALIWSRFKKLAKINISSNHFVGVSKHILELDKKILDWLESLPIPEPEFDKNNIDHILKALENILKQKSDNELEELKERILEKKKNGTLIQY
jgi:hypothetical protein